MLLYELFYAVASPIFRKMFETEMKEGKESRVEIEDFNKDTVDLMLKWMYSGQLELKEEDFDGHLKLFQASHKYGLDPLVTYLAAKMAVYHTTPEKALEIFELGHLYENDTMIEMAKQVIKK